MTSCATPSTASSCGSNAWIPSWRIWKRGGRCPPGDPDAAGGARTAPTYEGGQLDGQSLRWEPGGRHGPTRVADATLSPTGAGGIVAKQPNGHTELPTLDLLPDDASGAGPGVACGAAAPR